MDLNAEIVLSPIDSCSKFQLCCSQCVPSHSLLCKLNTAKICWGLDCSGVFIIVLPGSTSIAGFCHGREWCDWGLTLGISMRRRWWYGRPFWTWRSRGIAPPDGRGPPSFDHISCSAILPQCGWKVGERWTTKKRWDERWYTTMRCSGIYKIGKS